MKKVLLFILFSFSVFLLSGCDDSSGSGKNKSFTVNTYPPSIEDPIVEAPSSKALTPNNVAAVTYQNDFPLLWEVDGNKDDVLVLVKNGKVLDKVSDFAIYDWGDIKGEIVIKYYPNVRNDNKLILATTPDLLSFRVDDLIGSKIVKVGGDVKVTKNDSENTLTGAEDVMSFAEMIQGFARVEEYEDTTSIIPITRHRLNFEGQLFNDIAKVTVNNIEVHSSQSFKIKNPDTTIEISAEVPNGTIIENAVEQNGIKYAMYAGRVIEYPVLYASDNVTSYHLKNEKMPIGFNVSNPKENYAFNQKPFMDPEGDDIPHSVKEIAIDKLVLSMKLADIIDYYNSGIAGGGVSISIFFNNYYKHYPDGRHSISIIDNLFIEYNSY